MIPLLLVGEDHGPSPSGPRDDEHALIGHVGQRLARLGGVSFDDYLRRTVRTNLVRSPSDWGNVHTVARGVSRVEHMIESAGVVVLLGAKVARTLGMAHMPDFEWDRWGDEPPPLVARSPHPSGLNRWWNEPLNVERASEFWHVVLDARRIASLWVEAEPTTAGAL